MYNRKYVNIPTTTPGNTSYKVLEYPKLTQTYMPIKLVIIIIILSFSLILPLKLLTIINGINAHDSTDQAENIILKIVSALIIDKHNAKEIIKNVPILLYK